MSRDSPHTQKQILKERADKMAQPLKKEKATKRTLEILVFKLDDELYGLETVFVGEVYPLQDYTVLPGAPSFIFGLVNVRRKILTVVSLKHLFSLPHEPKLEGNIITLEDRQRSFGILTDSIEGIRTMPLEQLELPLPTFTGLKLEFMKGITVDRVAVLDSKKLLSSPHLIVDEAIGVVANPSPQGG
jgi:purine-binding chemotaxis protein CheW